MENNKNLELISKYKNPVIDIEWVDFIGNYGVDKENQIIEFFKKNYNAKEVKVNFKSKRINNSFITEANEEIGGSINTNIYDLNFQKILIKNFINKNEINKDLIEPILEHDEKINSILKERKEFNSKSSFWRLNYIEFSNFLSYGDNNNFNLDNYDGITSISSNPVNQGGKTVLIDLILFLLHNKTTKTKTNEEIFNIYRGDCDEVFVRGSITSNEYEYIIERRLKRSKKRKGDGYNVSADLVLIKKTLDGVEINQNEEQRRETEKEIKELVGSEDDLMLTIIATTNNLENLIDTKPTERGDIFSRFIGLDILEFKEKINKELISEFEKNLKSNIHNSSSLEIEIKRLDDEIIKYNKDIESNENDIKINTKNITKLNSEVNDLLAKREYVDEDLIGFNEEEHNVQVSKLNDRLTKNNTDISNMHLDIDKLDVDYDLEQHKQVELKVNGLKTDLAKYEGGLDSLVEDLTKTKEHEGEVKLIEEEVKAIEKDISSLEVKLNSINVTFNEKEFESLLNNISETTFKINNNKTNIKKTEESIANLENDSVCDKCKRPLDNIDEIKKHIEEHKLQIKNLNEDIDKLNAILVSLNADKAKMELEKNKIAEKKNIEDQIKDLKNKIENKNDKIKFYLTKIEKIPVIESRIKAGEEFIKKTKEDLNSYQTQLDSILKKYEDKKQKEIIIINIERIKVDNSKIENDLNTLANKLMRYNNSLIKINKNKELDDVLFKLRYDINALNDKNINLNGANMVNKSNIENNKKEIEKNKNIILEIIEEEKKLGILQTYGKIFSKKGLRSVIIGEILPYLNLECSRLMNGVCDFSIEIMMNDNNDVDFLMHDNELKIVKQLKTGSGYEKTISALTLRIVLREISNLPKTDFIFLDEINSKVGEENLEPFFMLIKKMKDKFRNIFIIAHDANIRDIADSFINIEKGKDKISRFI